LAPIAKSEEASRATENRSAVSVIANEAASTAERNLEAGRYYMTHGNYPGAINRFKAVVEQFPSSSVVDEALFRLAQAYLAIGIPKTAAPGAAPDTGECPESPSRFDALELLKKSGLELAQWEVMGQLDRGVAQRPLR